MILRILKQWRSNQVLNITETANRLQVGFSLHANLGIMKQN